MLVLMVKHIMLSWMQVWPRSNPSFSLHDSARGSKLKSGPEFVRSLRNHVLPTLGDRPYESIRNRDLAELKHAIVAKAGKHAAHGALKNLSTIHYEYLEEVRAAMGALARLVFDIVK